LDILPDAKVHFLTAVRERFRGVDVEMLMSILPFAACAKVKVFGGSWWRHHG
jgi:hypothetical protein